MTREYSPPAFATPPIYNPNTGDYIHGQPGMSLRDWFAGRAMQTILNGASAEEAKLPELYALISRLSYALADAMLAERAKGGER